MILSLPANYYIVVWCGLGLCVFIFLFVLWALRSMASIGNEEPRIEYREAPPVKQETVDVDHEDVTFKRI